MQIKRTGCVPGWVVLGMLLLALGLFLPFEVPPPRAFAQGEGSAGEGETCSAAGQFCAEYYNNRDLSGGPTFTRGESSLDHEWGQGGPGNGVSSDNFSVRWTGRFSFSGGTYTFIVRTDDGMRVWVDGSLIIDQWRDQPVTEYRASRFLSGGEYEIKVEYYERTGEAVAELRWESGCAANQYRAEYYNNRSLSGSPTFTRCEESINYDWGRGGPGNGLGTDDFSVRWTRPIDLAPDTYRFGATCDDGMRLRIDGRLIIDEWYDHPATTHTADVDLAAGTHTLEVEYYEHLDKAVARVSWAPTPATNEWHGEYFTNRWLSGSPAFVRHDEAIDFDWGSGAPDARIGADNFSIRWTGRFGFGGGQYTFVARTDDGMRVWVDGSLILDQWRDQPVTEYRVARSMSGGEHDIRVEYYENTGGAIAQFWWEPGGGNLALNRPAYATSQEAWNYSPPNGNDGNLSTRWSSRISYSLGGEWWWTDLGTQSFDQVTIRWQTAYAARHFIGWSNDGYNFTGYWYSIDAPGDYTYSLGPVTARYAGVYMDVPAMYMNNYSFWEFEVHRRVWGGVAAEAGSAEIAPSSDLVTLRRSP